MTCITSDHMINTIFLNADNIADYQHFVEPLQYVLEQHYPGDSAELVTAERSWLLAVHPVYGIVGGLCLSPPHPRSAVSYQNQPVFEVYPSVHDHWLASQLFFSHPTLAASYSATELMVWHAAIVKEFYQALIALSLTGKLAKLGVLIELKHYAYFNLALLPFVYQQHIHLNNQPFVLSYLLLPPQHKPAVDELALTINTTAHLEFTDEGEPDGQIIY